MYQSDNYQNILIFIALKYRSNMLVQSNIDHGLWLSIEFVKFCLSLIRKTIFM